MDAQQLMFALQSPVGLRFGATIQVDSDRVTFEMDLKIPKGTECPFRMELSGSENTVMGTVRIEKLLPKRGSDTPRYVARIVDMPDNDRMAYDGWRRDLATGGVSRRLERDPQALKEQMSSQMMSGLSASQSKAVLDRMNKRRANYKPDTDQPVVDFGLADERDSAVESDRDNIRKQLRSSAEPSTAVQKPAPVQTSVIETPDSAAEPDRGFAVVDRDQPAEDSPDKATARSEPASEPATSDSKPSIIPTPSWMPSPKERPNPVPASSSPPPSAPNPSPPLVVVNAEARPIEVTVVYLSDESFVEDYKKTLHTSAVTIDHPDLTELYQPVNVKLQMANGDSVETIGHMVAQTPEGMAIAMEFDPAQRAILKKASGL
jgi:hypothetical protein